MIGFVWAVLFLLFLVEGSSQLFRWGVYKTWIIKDRKGISGFILHPLLIFIEKGAKALAHELYHAHQMVRDLWTLWWAGFVFSGRKRVFYEAEADVYTLPVDILKNDLRLYAEHNAKALVDETYFPTRINTKFSWLNRIVSPVLAYVSRKQNPGEDYASGTLWSLIIQRRVDLVGWA